MIKTAFCASMLLSSTLYADYFRDATLAYRGGNFEEARKNFELSVKKESGWQSYFYLGKIYLYGEGVDANPSQAIPYLEQAVMRGNMKAKCYLAEAYIKTKSKPEEALLLLSQEAKEIPLCQEIASKYAISLTSH